MIHFEPRKWDVRKRIMAVLVYFNIFDLALTAKSISNLILGEKVNEIKVISELEKMAGQVVSDGSLYALTDRTELFEETISKEKQAEALLSKVNRFIWIFKCIPFLKGVAVCNYLSLRAVDEESDIDLLIITKSGRIFLTRVMLTFVMQIMGLRRHGSKIKGRFCLSFYVCDSALNFDEILLKPYDIYFIYWLKALMPVYGEKSVWNKLGKDNDWMKNFIDWNIDCENLESSKFLFALFSTFVLGGFIGDIFEKLLQKYFTGKYLKKVNALPLNASVIVNEKMLKYHNNDRRAFFRNEFEDGLNSCGFSE